MIVLSYSPYKNGIISNFLMVPNFEMTTRISLQTNYFIFLIFLSFWSHSKISVFRHFPYFLWNWPIQKWWEALKIECGFIRNWSEFFDRNPNLLNIEPPFCYWENIIISGYNLSRLSEGHFLSLKPVSSASNTLNQLPWLSYPYPKKVFSSQKYHFLSQKHDFEDEKRLN